MVPIYFTKNGRREGYEFEEFARKFTSICQSHRLQNRALAFAFILCDYEHPEVRKVLTDDTYWDALNKISGTYLSVFSFQIDSAQQGGDGFSTAQEFVRQQFGANVATAEPVLLFFQVQADRVSGAYVVKLTAKTIESTFHEIRDVLTDAVDSVRYVVPEFRGNTAEIFDLIQQRLRQRKGLLIIKKVIGIVTSTQEWVGKLTGTWR